MRLNGYLFLYTSRYYKENILYKRDEDMYEGECKIIITRVELVNDELITRCPFEGRSPLVAFQIQVVIFCKWCVPAVGGEKFTKWSAGECVEKANHRYKLIEKLYPRWMGKFMDAEAAGKRCRSSRPLVI